MKRYLLKIISAALTGVMFISASIPAAAAENNITVIDLASAPMVISEGTPTDYPNPSGTDITINVVDENGNSLGTVEQTATPAAGQFVQLKAEENIGDKKFSHYEYVTPARNYTASYERDFTFYFDPPMTINVVYTNDPDTSDQSPVVGMYKAPEVKNGDTYFYCAVAGARGDNTTASITFGRSQKNEAESDNSETFNTNVSENIYYTDDENPIQNTFQYIVSSGIQTGAPIDFETNVAGANTNIKTWDLNSSAFYNSITGANGLTVSYKGSDEVFTFNTNIDDKVRVYAQSDSVSVSGAELTVKTTTVDSSYQYIYEYVAKEKTVTVTGQNIKKIMVNPMDAAITEDGQPNPQESTISVIDVRIISSADEHTLISGASVTAVKSDNSEFKFTIPEVYDGYYAISAPEGTYNITAEFNGAVATETATVESGKTVYVDISIKDIEAEREEKINTLLKQMLKENNALNGSDWNTESSDTPKWSYINGCMTTAFMDIFEVTDDEQLKADCFNATDGFQNTSIRDNLKTAASTGTSSSDDRDLSTSKTLDDINPAKSILDIIEISNKDDKYNSENITKFTNFVKQKIAPIYKNVDRIENGNFYHKDTYPHQVWLDGTYMALPFMIQYKRLFPNESLDGETTELEIINDVVNQFKNIEAKMKDDTTGLYYHGYDAQADSDSGNDYNPKTAMSWAQGTKATDTNIYVFSDFRSEASKVGCSDSFWSRAMGWFAMALVDSYEQIDLLEKENKGSFSSQKADIVRIYQNLMDAVIDKQDDATGMWKQVMYTPKNEYNASLNYFESSGTATFAAALMKGYNLKMVTDEKYYNAGLKAFNGLTDEKLVVENGEAGLKDICKSAGLAGVKFKNNKPSSTQNAKTKFTGDETSPLKGVSGTNGEHLERDGSFNYYLTEPVVENDAKGAAPYLMAYAQKLKHDKNLQSAKG